MNKELNCMNCSIGDFKHALCDCDSGFCKEFKSIGTEEDFFNAVMERIRPQVPSEDCISREWIYDALLEYGFTAPDMTVTELIEDAPSVVPQVPSEDCISREWVKGICEMMLDEEMLGHMLGYIEEAPSVTTEQSCDTCRHNKLEWFSEECSGCTKANSNWERIEE